jgi:hypothetical protein
MMFLPGGGGQFGLYGSELFLISGYEGNSSPQTGQLMGNGFSDALGTPANNGSFSG